MAITTRPLETGEKILGDREEIRMLLPEAWRGHHAGFINERIFLPPKHYSQQVINDLVGGITPQNSHLREQLLALETQYTARRLVNSTLFTLQAVGIDTVEIAFTALDIERKSMRDGWKYGELESPAMALVFGLCSYFEQVAMVEGVVEGMRPTYATLVSACVRTQDNQLIFGRRVGSAVGKIGVVGGTLSESEQRMSNGVYRTPDFAMGDEVTQELGLEEDDFVAQLKAIIEDEVVTRSGTYPRPILYSRVDVRMSASELDKKFRSNPSALLEHSELINVPDTTGSILDFMRANPPEQFHPPADAILMLALESSMRKGFL